MTVVGVSCPEDFDVHKHGGSALGRLTPQSIERQKEMLDQLLEDCRLTREDLAKGLSSLEILSLEGGVAVMRTDAYNEGYDDGYSVGYEDGHKDGYDEGHFDGGEA